MIYFDNAATSYPKPKSTLTALRNCIKSSLGNPSRSSHFLSRSAGEAVYTVREKVADIFSLSDPENVVFTLNATHSLNMAIKAFVTEKCHIIISDAEHNSVVRPIYRLCEKLGVELSEYDFEKDPHEAIIPLIRNDTVGIISTIVSNVTGHRGNLAALSSIAEKYGLFLIIDASQAAGHTLINLDSTPCDVLCAPAHKSLLGIPGAGIAIFKSKKRAETILEGGSGTNSIDKHMPILLPEGYEAGTLPTPSICALGGGLDFIKKIGVLEIEDKINRLTHAAYEMLSDIQGMKIYGASVGIVSFNLCEYNSLFLSSLLDDQKICTRGGLHCSPSVHKKLGTTETGAVRLSFSYFNSENEIYKLYKILRAIKTNNQI